MSAKSAEQRLAELGLILPPPSQPAGNYVPGVVVGQLAFMSGCVARRPDGSGVRGKLGGDLSVEQGHEAARLAALVMLANIRALLGSLDHVARVVKVLGMINAAPDFEENPKVIDGFSDVMVAVFGEARGRGARAAVGMAALSRQHAVEVEMVLEVAQPMPGPTDPEPYRAALAAISTRAAARRACPAPLDTARRREFPGPNGRMTRREKTIS